MAAIIQGLKKLRTDSKSNLLKNYSNTKNTVKFNGNDALELNNSNEKVIQGIRNKKTPEHTLSENRLIKNCIDVCNKDVSQTGRSLIEIKSSVDSKMMRENLVPIMKKGITSGLSMSSKVMTYSPNYIIPFESNQYRCIHCTATNRRKEKWQLSADVSTQNKEKTKAISLYSHNNKLISAYIDKKQSSKDITQCTNINFNTSKSEFKSELIKKGFNNVLDEGRSAAKKLKECNIIYSPETFDNEITGRKYFKVVAHTIDTYERNMGAFNAINDTPVLRCTQAKSNKQKRLLTYTTQYHNFSTFVKRYKKIVYINSKIQCTKICNSAVLNNNDVTETSHIKSVDEHEDDKTLDNKSGAIDVFNKDEIKISSKSSEENTFSIIKNDSTCEDVNNDEILNLSGDEDPTKHLLKLKSLMHAFSHVNSKEQEPIPEELLNNFDGVFQIITTKNPRLQYIKLKSRPNLFTPENIEFITLLVTEKNSSGNKHYPVPSLQLIETLKPVSYIKDSIKSQYSEISIGGQVLKKEKLEKQNVTNINKQNSRVKLQSFHTNPYKNMASNDSSFISDNNPKPENTLTPLNQGALLSKQKTNEGFKKSYVKTDNEYRCMNHSTELFNLYQTKQNNDEIFKLPIEIRIPKVEQTELIKSNTSGIDILFKKIHKNNFITNSKHICTFLKAHTKSIISEHNTTLPELVKPNSNNIYLLLKKIIQNNCIRNAEHISTLLKKQTEIKSPTSEEVNKLLSEFIEIKSITSGNVKLFTEPTENKKTRLEHVPKLLANPEQIKSHSSEYNNKLLEEPIENKNIRSEHVQKLLAKPEQIKSLPSEYKFSEQPIENKKTYSQHVQKLLEETKQIKTFSSENDHKLLKESTGNKSAGSEKKQKLLKETEHIKSLSSEHDHKLLKGSTENKSAGSENILRILEETEQIRCLSLQYDLKLLKESTENKSSASEHVQKVLEKTEQIKSLPSEHDLKLLKDSTGNKTICSDYVQKLVKEVKNIRCSISEHVQELFKNPTDIKSCKNPKENKSTHSEHDKILKDATDIKSSTSEHDNKLLNELAGMKRFASENALNELKDITSSIHSNQSTELSNKSIELKNSSSVNNNNNKLFNKPTDSKSSLYGNSHFNQSTVITSPTSEYINKLRCKADICGLKTKYIYNFFKNHTGTSDRNRYKILAKEFTKIRTFKPKNAEVPLQESIHNESLSFKHGVCTNEPTDMEKSNIQCIEPFLGESTNNKNSSSELVSMPSKEFKELKSSKTKHVNELPRESSKIRQSSLKLLDNMLLNRHHSQDLNTGFKKVVDISNEKHIDLPLKESTKIEDWRIEPKDVKDSIKTLKHFKTYNEREDSEISVLDILFKDNYKYRRNVHDAMITLPSLNALNDEDTVSINITSYKDDITKLHGPKLRNTHNEKQSQGNRLDEHTSNEQSDVNNKTTQDVYNSTIVHNSTTHLQALEKFVLNSKKHHWNTRIKLTPKQRDTRNKSVTTENNDEISLESGEGKKQTSNSVDDLSKNEIKIVTKRPVMKVSGINHKRVETYTMIYKSKRDNKFPNLSPESSNQNLRPNKSMRINGVKPNHIDEESINILTKCEDYNKVNSKRTKVYKNSNDSIYSGKQIMNLNGNQPNKLHRFINTVKHINRSNSPLSIDSLRSTSCYAHLNVNHDRSTVTNSKKRKTDIQVSNKVHTTIVSLYNNRIESLGNRNNKKQLKATVQNSKTYETANYVRKSQEKPFLKRNNPQGKVRNARSSMLSNQKNSFQELKNINDEDVKRNSHNLVVYRNKYKKLHALNYSPFMKMEKSLKCSYDNTFEKTNSNDTISTIYIEPIVILRPSLQQSAESRSNLHESISESMYKSYRENLKKNMKKRFFVESE